MRAVDGLRPGLIVVKYSSGIFRVRPRGKRGDVRLFQVVTLFYELFLFFSQPSIIP